MTGVVCAMSPPPHPADTSPTVTDPAGSPVRNWMRESDQYSRQIRGPEEPSGPAPSTDAKVAPVVAASVAAEEPDSDALPHVTFSRRTTPSDTQPAAASLDPKLEPVTVTSSSVESPHTQGLLPPAAGKGHGRLAALKPPVEAEAAAASAALPLNRGCTADTPATAGSSKLNREVGEGVDADVSTAGAPCQHCSVRGMPLPAPAAGSATLMFTLPSGLVAAARVADVRGGATSVRGSEPNRTARVTVGSSRGTPVTTRVMVVAEPPVEAVGACAGVTDRMEGGAKEMVVPATAALLPLLCWPATSARTTRLTPVPGRVAKLTRESLSTVMAEGGTAYSLPVWPYVSDDSSGSDVL